MILLSDIFPTPSHSQMRVRAIISNLIFWDFFPPSLPLWAPLQPLKLGPLCKICKRKATAHSEWKSACRSSEQRRNLGGSRRAWAEFLSHDFIMKGIRPISQNRTLSRTRQSELFASNPLNPAASTGDCKRKIKLCQIVFFQSCKPAETLQRCIKVTGTNDYKGP